MYLPKDIQNVYRRYARIYYIIICDVFAVCVSRNKFLYTVEIRVIRVYTDIIHNFR